MNTSIAGPGWAHRRPAFFPWHRVMLLAFETSTSPPIRRDDPLFGLAGFGVQPSDTGLLRRRRRSGGLGRVKTRPFAHDDERVDAEGQGRLR